MDEYGVYVDDLLALADYPFRHLSRELGAFLGDYLATRSGEYITRVAYALPDWYITNTLTGGNELMGLTPLVALWRLSGAGVGARRDADDLYAWADVPWLELGEFYYLDKLALAVDATVTIPDPPPDPETVTRKPPVATPALNVVTSLSEVARLNTESPITDVQLRYFAGPLFATILATGLTATLASWTAPDTGKPGTFTEITSRVSFEGSETITQAGSSITFDAALRGTDYDDALFGIGRLIVCWRRIYRATWTETAGAGWQAWEVAYVGQVTTGENTDNWKRGQAWRRTVTGYNAYLERYNAPRTTAGRLQVTDGAGATGTTELANPGLEADQGEFVGGTTSVALANMVDGNPATVYISSTEPTMTDPGGPGMDEDGGILLTEVSVWPVTGFPAARCWWAEFFNQRSQVNDLGITVYTGGWVDGAPQVMRTMEAPERIGAGAWGVACASQYWFDRAWGGDGGSVLADVSQWSPETQAPLPLDGMVAVSGSAIAWAPGGASRYYLWDNNTLWDGPTFDSDLIGPGDSLVYDWVTETWSVNSTPHPGSSRLGDGPVWVQVTLPENVCETTDEIDGASTEIPLTSLVGWVIPPNRTSSQGVIASNVFNWTGKSGSSLTGVTWVDVPGAAIPASTQCYPYENGEAQTGLPLTATHLVRRKTPAVAIYDVYWSNFEARGYLDGGWRADYYAQTHHVDNPTHRLRLTDQLSDGTNGYLWVRSWMYLIHWMQDEGRCKINEIEADLHQLAVDFGPLPYVDGTRVIDLARSLWVDWVGLAAADFADDADPYAHYAGQHSIAITPVARVYDDLARIGGCLVRYGPDSQVHWQADPWQPGLETPTEYTYTFSRGSVRGDVTVRQEAITVDYVVVNATSFEGSPHPVRVVYPQPEDGNNPPVWAMTKEISNLVVARDVDAVSAAKRELAKLRTGDRKVNLNVKGVATWALPGQRVGLTWDLDGDDMAETSSWLIEKVTHNRALGGGRRAWQTALELRSFLTTGTEIEEI